MISNVTTVLTSVLAAIGDFITPTASGEGGLITATAVAALATVFAIPIAIKAIKKAISLIKGV